MDQNQPASAIHQARAGWLAPTLLGLGLFTLYSANGRAIGAGDVVPAGLLSVALVRGDGLVLDRFEHALRTPEGRLPGYVTESRGRIVSRYPIGPALLAAPWVAPQVLILDQLRPGWEHDRETARRYCERIGKNAASAITSLAVVLLGQLLLGLGLGRLAWPTALVAALGGGYWPVASQALWQHGPAALCLTAAMLFLLPERPSRFRLALAGSAMAMVVASRPIDLVFAAIGALWVLTHHRRPERFAFFIPAIVGAVALSTYNVWFFDTLTGGYAQIEQMHPWAHGTRGTFTGSLWNGGLGTLFSPSHGLFVYSPWVALALATLAVPAVRQRMRGWSLGFWLTAGLVPYFILLAKYSCWWGGHSFGPRFWIDAMPLFAPILGFGLAWAWPRRRAWLTIFALAVSVSITIQLIGFLCYPSSWHGTPTNVDRDHARLWDWTDNELTRGLLEGVRPRSW